MPFYVLFKGQVVNQEVMMNSSEVNTMVRGFTLNWFLKDANDNQLTETERLEACSAKSKVQGASAGKNGQIGKATQNAENDKRID